MTENNSPEKRPSTAVIQQQKPEGLAMIWNFVGKHYLEVLLSGSLGAGVLA